MQGFWSILVLVQGLWGLGGGQLLGSKAGLQKESGSPLAWLTSS